ncbi:hypothetical protein SAMN05421770_101461 [Granulicella rosea]|uniref:Uncharacterized protein n=1 Tax=Granulicella rosea TaxID=474952 RepID=A0A239DIJ5_9BACT|nr:hypothetical protein [Granulicella rosea]SNS31533.1 hypothetical protein SAMN05421770_101461 [Granulicella rosea]
MLPSEVRRVQTAIDNKNAKELEWSLWYCRMRQTVSSARPADAKYWRAMEAEVEAALAPPPPPKVYPAKKKKKGVRGLGFGPVDENAEASTEPSGEETA